MIQCVGCGKQNEGAQPGRDSELCMWRVGSGGGKKYYCTPNCWVKANQIGHISDSLDQLMQDWLQRTYPDANPETDRKIRHYLLEMNQSS